jgi:hypothetical protein
MAMQIERQCVARTAHAQSQVLATHPASAGVSPGAGWFDAKLATIQVAATIANSPNNNLLLNRVMSTSSLTAKSLISYVDLVH